MDDSYEVYICGSPNQPTISKDQFAKVLHSIRKIARTADVEIGKPFKKMHLKKFYEDIILEQVYQDQSEDSSVPIYASTPSRESVYSMQYKDSSTSLLGGLQQQNQLTTLNFKKQKLTLPHFPSTHKVYEMICEMRHIFKINNRTYVNFMESQYKSDKTNKLYYSIMINYEHEVNSDSQLHVEMIQTVITSILSAL